MKLDLSEFSAIPGRKLRGAPIKTIRDGVRMFGSYPDAMKLRVPRGWVDKCSTQKRVYAVIAVSGDRERISVTLTTDRETQYARVVNGTAVSCPELAQIFPKAKVRCGYIFEFDKLSDDGMTATFLTPPYLVDDSDD